MPRALRVPAELVIWRNNHGNLCTSVKAPDMQVESDMTVKFHHSYAPDLDRYYQEQNPEDVVHQRIASVMTREGKPLHDPRSRDYGGRGLKVSAPPFHVSLSAGKDYPTFLVSAWGRTSLELDGTEVIVRIKGRLSIEPGFVLLTHLVVHSEQNNSTWGAGFSPTGEYAAVVDPTSDVYRDTFVHSLLVALRRGVDEIGHQHALWPGRKVALCGLTEDDSEREKWKVETFTTPLGDVQMTHLDGGVNMAFSDFDIDGHKVSAVAELRRKSQESSEDHQARLSTWITGPQDVPMAARYRMSGIFQRAAQHVLDTHPDWYGLSLRIL